MSDQRRFVAAFDPNFQHTTWAVFGFDHRAKALINLGDAAAQLGSQRSGPRTLHHTLKSAEVSLVVSHRVVVHDAPIHALIPIDNPARNCRTDCSSSRNRAIRPEESCLLASHSAEPDTCSTPYLGRSKGPNNEAFHVSSSPTVRWPVETTESRPWRLGLWELMLDKISPPRESGVLGGVRDNLGVVTGLSKGAVKNLLAPVAQLDRATVS